MVGRRARALDWGVMRQLTHRRSERAPAGAGRRIGVLVALLVAAAVSSAAFAGEAPLLRLGRELSEGATGLDVERLTRAAGRLWIELPDGRVTELRRTGFERRGAGEISWWGRAADGSEAVLTAAAGRLAATVTADGRIFRLSPAPEGVQLTELDDRRFPNCGGAGPPPAPAVSAAGAGVEASGAVPSVSRRAPLVDVLVLYTPAVRQAVGSVGNLEVVARHYVDFTNVGYHNSRMEVRVRLAGTAEVTIPEGAIGSNSLTIDWLRSSPEVAALRDDARADIVGVLYERGSRFCGSAGMLFRPAGDGTVAARAAVFEMQRFCGSHTFAHEIGHLFGADHNPENAAASRGDTRYPYGKGHYHDRSYRTIMSYAEYCEGPCPVQAFFSNPAVRHDRLATGIAEERDNARLIDELAPFVADFRAAGDDPAVCALAPGDDGYCAACGPCVAGEGDCDADVDCGPGLLCAAGRGADYGLPASTDVCVARRGCDLDPGDGDYCRLCGPCGFGEGDCDAERECQAGLVCVEDVGAEFGLAPATDVCGYRDRGFCPLPLGHPDYCATCGPCDPGEGGCRRDSDCGLATDCYEGVGARYGYAAGTNVCLRTAPDECVREPGHPAYCAVCGTCGEGEGDCDGDRECAPGLACVDGAGPERGFGPEIDLCLESAGGGLEAPRRLRAKVLSATEVRLRWRDRSAGESGFHVELSREGGPFERVASAGADRRRLVLRGLEPGATYTFRVQAHAAAGASPYSNEVTVTLPAS